MKSKQECMSLVRLINRMARNALLVSKEVEPVMTAVEVVDEEYKHGYSNGHYSHERHSHEN